MSPFGDWVAVYRSHLHEPIDLTPIERLGEPWHKVCTLSTSVPRVAAFSEVGGRDWALAGGFGNLRPGRCSSWRIPRYVFAF